MAEIMCHVFIDADTHIVNNAAVQVPGVHEIEREQIVLL